MWNTSARGPRARSPAPCTPRCSRRPPGARSSRRWTSSSPPARPAHSNPHPKGVVEHVLLTEGRLRAGPAGASTDIDTGDVLRFPGDVPHSYAALDDKPARAIALMAY